jgi:hypothetical protein
MFNTQPIEGTQVPLANKPTIATNIATIVNSLIKWVSISFITLVIATAVTSISILIMLNYSAPLIEINDNGLELLNGSIRIKKNDTVHIKNKDANCSLTITDGSITFTEEVKKNDIKEE